VSLPNQTPPFDGETLMDNLFFFFKKNYSSQPLWKYQLSYLTNQLLMENSIDFLKIFVETSLKRIVIMTAPVSPVFRCSGGETWWGGKTDICGGFCQEVEPGLLLSWSVHHAWQLSEISLHGKCYLPNQIFWKYIKWKI